MVERKSWAVSSGGGEITTLDGRHAFGSVAWPTAASMGKRTGRLPHTLTAFNVTATSPTPDGFVHVSPGHLWLMGTRSIAPYICTMDAIKDINILSTPADLSLTRWDLIVAQQNDTLHGDANNLFEVKQIVGSPSSTPADPPVPGSPDYVVLARVVVGAGVSSITGANITQLLTAFTVPIGAILPVLDQADRDTLTGTRYDGMSIWRRDRDWIEVYDGTAWRVQGLAICSSTSDRDTAITNPKEGQFAVTTDTGLVWRRTASAWVPHPIDSLSDIQNASGTTTSTSYTFTLAGGGVGCGLAFVAPPSGKVLIHNEMQLNIATSGFAFCSINVKTGAVIGSGTDVIAPSDDEAVTNDVTARRFGVARLVTGLTPGASYNVKQAFKSSSGNTATFVRKQLIVMAG